MFIQVIEGRTTDPEALHRRIDLWQEELEPGATGYLGSAGGCTADGSFILAVRFVDRAAAERNARREEQTAWWSETEACFDGPVSFHETEDVHVMAHGALGDAGFVQVMEGHVSDRAAADRLELEADPLLAELRPDLLGSITAYFSEDEFADIAFFTTEREARENESREMPPEFSERFDQWERVMKVERYLDIPDPWVASAH